ncbi:MAG: helix-turn-helix domain-containing protein [Bacteroidota bacterium]|nr:helix-turn-helix domain-containing protein [Bacteroidota bacterium]
MYIEQELAFLKETVEKLTGKMIELETKVNIHVPEPMFSVAQAAKRLKLSNQGVLYHIREGNLKATGTERKKQISSSELNRFINHKHKTL